MKQYKNKDWLNKEYWNEELNTFQIGRLCNCSHQTIRRWLRKLNIKIRSISEAQHLAKANHCKLSDEARQWIDGEIMGDGCLYSRSKYSARFHYSSKYLEYINYVSGMLKSFGIKQSGKIHKRYNKGFNCYIYLYHSLDYKELLPIRKRWYPEGKKTVSRDLKLTSLMLRQWFIGDGNLIHRKNGRPHITLATCGFPIPDVEWLVEQLSKMGFKATRQFYNNIIRISTHSTKQFLDYIDECPVECYRYKFNY